MKIVMDLMLWLAPFFLVSGGFCLSRFKKMRFQRYVFYAVILCVAFLIDLNSLKFSNHWLNVTWFLSLTLIFSEIFWSVNRFKNRLFYSISLVMGILILNVQTVAYQRLGKSARMESKYINIRRIVVG